MIVATPRRRSAAEPLQAAGAVLIAAANSGTISTTLTSDSIGTVETTVGSDAAHPGDVVLAEIDGVTLSVGSLSLSAIDATNYSSIGHIVANSVYGSTQALLENSSADMTAGGLSLLADDGSTITGEAISYDIGNNHVGAVGADFMLTASSVINIVNKSVMASIDGTTVNAAGSVLVRRRTSCASSAMRRPRRCRARSISPPSRSAAPTSTTICSARSALVSNSSITTTVLGDVKVERPTRRSPTAPRPDLDQGPDRRRARRSIAVNTIGFVAGSAAGSATADILLGTSFFSSEPGSAVQAKVTNSTVHAAGNLLVAAIGAGLINATVSNVTRSTQASVPLTAPISGAVGAVLATNKISRSAVATITEPDTTHDLVTAGKSVTVKAQDKATIASNVTVVTSSVAATDGDLKYVNQIIGAVLPFDFGIDQKNVALAFGDQIKLAANYDTNLDLFGDTTTKTETLVTGDIVHVVAGSPADTGQGNTLYRYIGAAPGRSISITRQWPTTPTHRNGLWSRARSTRSTSTWDRRPAPPPCRPTTTSPISTFGRKIRRSR